MAVFVFYSLEKKSWIKEQSVPTHPKEMAEEIVQGDD